jgi:hypothetical protein
MGEVLHIETRASERKKRKQILDAERDYARPFLNRWHKEVEAKVRAGRLPDLSTRFAKLLTNYPSANQGSCWPGQPEMAGKLGKSVRTIGYLISLFVKEGLLRCKQRGLNKSNVYIYQIASKDIFPSRQNPAGQDRQNPADYPLESDPLESDPLESTSSLSSKRPREKLIEDNDEGDPIEHNTIDRIGKAVLPRSEPGASAETASGLPMDGEVLPPANISFPRFWNHSRRRSHPKDSPGPARKRWEVLSEADRSEIAALLDRDGEINLGLMWTCVWLDHRCWREEPLRRSGTAGALDRLGRFEPLPLSLPASTRPPEGHYAIREHTEAFNEWCRYLRQHRIIVPFVSSIVDENGKRVQGFYRRSPRPPDEQPEPR